MAKNYYEILEVDTNATLEEIKISYKKLVKKFHPDLNKENGAEETFKKINEAFDILSDEVKRLKYDTLKGIEPKPKNQTEEEEQKEHISNDNNAKENKNTKNEKTFGDFVNKFFEEKKSKIKSIKGEDIYMTLEITTKEALEGVIKKVNIVHSELCSKCEGRKFINGTKCTLCDGKGEISVQKKVTITIPKNPKQDSVIKIKNEGKLGKYGGKTGDLYIKIKISPKKIFKLEDGIAHLELPITPWEGFFGCDITIPTLNGNATIKIPPQTNSHDRFKITNGGILDKKSGKRGDLIIEIKICVPQKPTIEELRAYKEIKKTDKSDVRKELFE